MADACSQYNVSKVSSVLGLAALDLPPHTEWNIAVSMKAVGQPKLGTTNAEGCNAVPGAATIRLRERQ